jgi:crossover junction endonuclease MUS81
MIERTPFVLRCCNVVRVLFQQFRLRQCGLQNVIYLIEKFGNEARLGLPASSLHQAIVNTQVVDNFFVKTTNSHKDSMAYLSVFTNLLTNIFKVSLIGESVYSNV